jgi:hypothetical protein
MYNAGATLCWNNMLNVLCSDPFYFFIDINLENASAFLLFFDRKEKAEMAGYSMCCTLCTSFIRRRSTPPHPQATARREQILCTQPTRHY